MPILIFFSFLSFFAIGNYWPILLKLSTLELHITLRWFSSQFLVCLFSCPFSFSDSFLAPYTIIFLALISLPFSLLQVLSWEISPIYRASFFFFLPLTHYSGYQYRYVFTISPDPQSKFASSCWIVLPKGPVFTLKANQKQKTE